MPLCVYNAWVNVCVNTYIYISDGNTMILSIQKPHSSLSYVIAIAIAIVYVYDIIHIYQWNTNTQNKRKVFMSKLCVLS